MSNRRTFLKQIGTLAFTVPLSFSTPYLAQAMKQQEYDLIIYGATPGGIAMAVTAARKGLSVHVINHNKHLGGMLTSGLGDWESLYEGKRSPINDELKKKILDHYKHKYGKHSTQYKNSFSKERSMSTGLFEPKVAELMIDQMIEKEENITIKKDYIPYSADVKSKSIKSVTFVDKRHTHALKVKAKIYADCSYEGDLMKVANVPYAVGRESRDEYNEPHAGKIFMRQLWDKNKYNKNLDLTQLGGSQAIIFPESTGEGDGLVQAYNLRTILSSDPANQRMPQPTSDYDPEYLSTLSYTSTIKPIPNNKMGWNRPQVIGPQNKYVEGDWKVRKEVYNLHRKTAINLLYFLQNDESRSKESRKFWSQYGFALDEFTDNNNFPYEIYARETRRLKGKYVLTQYDQMPSGINMERPPIHSDSIAITEWYMDCHGCETLQTRDSLEEGKMMPHYTSYPGQIPFRSIMSPDMNNLLVPVCLSSTHVAWGGVRLEPTWTNIAESAGLAVVLAVKQNYTLAEIPKEQLLMNIAEHRIMTTFYNDFDISSNEAWVPAVQYFGSKGFFPSYNLKINKPLDRDTARIWCSALRDILNDDHNAQETASTINNNKTNEVINSDQLKTMLSTFVQDGIKGAKISHSGKLTRGEAITYLYKWFKNKLKQPQV